VVDLLAGDPVLLAFLVIGLGAGVGTIRAWGVALGPAAALFVGLAIGAIDESLSGAQGLGLLRELGLVLFTYTIGLASGPTFVNGVRRGGSAAIVVTVVLVAGLAGLCAGVAGVLDLAPAERAGLFAGSTTNEPSAGPGTALTGRVGAGRGLRNRLRGSWSPSRQVRATLLTRCDRKGWR
jgi:putative transport protein